MPKNLDWDLLRKSKKFLTIMFFFIITIGMLRVISGTNMPITVVASGSMEPTVPMGSIAFIKKVQGYEILADERPIGDIIVYKSPNTKVYDFFIVTIYDPPPILHRAIKKVEINGKYYILTKGDANLYPDFNPNNPKSWISEDMIIGKLVWHMPYLGYLFLWLRNPFAIIALIIFIIIIILIPREKNTKI